jgi:hypothetical protein
MRAEPFTGGSGVGRADEGGPTISDLGSLLRWASFLGPTSMNLESAFVRE